MHAPMCVLGPSFPTTSFDEVAKIEPTTCRTRASCRLAVQGAVGIKTMTVSLDCCRPNLLIWGQAWPNSGRMRFATVGFEAMGGVWLTRDRS